jgi:hypothetical protein
MKFFNIDMHVSVIEDLSRTLQSLGHQVVSVNMSGHSWVLGRTPAAGFGPVNTQTWRDVSADQFYNSCKNKLASFDGFIVTYPPSLAQIYERFNKPIIVYMPIRYEYPYHDNPAGWQRLNAFFHRMHAAKKLLVVSNSVYDQEYFHYFTGIRPLYIPSMCDYCGVSSIGADHSVVRPSLIMDCRGPGAVAECAAATGAKPVRSVYGKYQWSDLVKHPGMVHIPYNCSLMSFFEHYSMNVPLYVPTPDFLLDLALRHGVLTELTWNGYFKLGPGSRIKGVRQDLPDPNDFSNLAGIRTWMNFYDYYQFPLVQQFPSFADLKQKLWTTVQSDYACLMLDHNKARKVAIKNSWSEALKTIGG